ncbi:MAG: hypothetical protein H6536_09430 [Bacteroidales bacterium]|nr:hypothetical protein [Bacteroidales bacterium]
MKTRRLTILVFCVFFIIDAFSQDNKEGYFIIDNLNRTYSVDSIKLFVNKEFPVEINVFKNGKEEVMSPRTIKGFEQYGQGFSYIFESILDMQNEKFDFSKNGIFLIRDNTGKIEFFTMHTKKDVLHCAKYNNKWYVFDMPNKSKKIQDFFNDKPLVSTNIANLLKTCGYCYNEIIDMANYYNEPPSEYFGSPRYDNIDSLCNDFINAIKSDNNEVISQYAKRIFLNKYYNDFFIKYRFKYRGYPFPTDEELETNIVRETNLMIKIKDYWKKNYKLDSIKLIGIEKSMEDTIDFRYNIKFTELSINVKTNIEENWSLGELINVNGKWILLFDPK